MQSWCLYIELQSLNSSLTTDEAKAQLIELTKAVILFYLQSVMFHH